MENNDVSRIQLARWLQQLQNGMPDAQLTQALAAQLARQRTANLHQLLTVLAEAPAAETVDAWLQAWLMDEIPSGAPTPRFDLSFLQPSPVQGTEQTATTGTPDGQNVLNRIPLAAVQDRIITIAAGIRQIGERLSITFAELMTGMQGQPQYGWVARSGADEDKLFQCSLPEEDSPWGGEITAFAEDAEHCRVEIMIYRPDTPDAELANIPITLQISATQQLSLRTDSGGVVEFTGIPRSSLPDIIVQIGAA